MKNTDYLYLIDRFIKGEDTRPAQESDTTDGITESNFECVTSQALETFLRHRDIPSADFSQNLKLVFNDDKLIRRFTCYLIGQLSLFIHHPDEVTVSHGNEPLLGLEVFESYLLKEFKKKDLARKMFELSIAHQYCSGFLNNLEDDKKRMKKIIKLAINLQEKYDVKPNYSSLDGNLSYSATEFEEILISELGVSAEQASRFTKIQEDFLIEAGVM